MAEVRYGTETFMSPTVTSTRSGFSPLILSKILLDTEKKKKD